MMFNSQLQSLRKQITSARQQKSFEKVSYVSLRVDTRLLSNILPIANDEDYYYWSQPDSNHTVIGIGTLVSFTSEGNRRFAELQTNYQQLLTLWMGQEHPKPIAFLAFAFNPDDVMSDSWKDFANTTLIIPEIIIIEKNHSQQITFNLKITQLDDIEPLLLYLQQKLEYLFKANNTTEVMDFGKKNKFHIHSALPEKATWIALTKKAIADIQSDKLKKLVTSRRLSIQGTKPFNLTQLLKRLRQRYPGCTIIACKNKNTQLVAASPERLLSLQENRIQSDAIGGTISYNDERLPGQLISEILSSDNKLLLEHAIIAEAIYHKLAPFCTSLSMPVSPIVMKLHNLCHLETPITGHVSDRISIFDLVSALHPTPAIAGFPTDVAQQWLTENENYDRGWYTGAFGWIDAENNGEFSVLLRCALFQGDQLELFAGAGLVAESVAEMEWQETELKIKTILDLI